MMNVRCKWCREPAYDSIAVKLASAALGWRRISMKRLLARSEVEEPRQVCGIVGGNAIISEVQHLDYVLQEGVLCLIRFQAVGI